MAATERLYYFDSHLIEFEAHVVDISERVSGWSAVTLDRTAFYPNGGGQPSDTGTLDGARVVECIDEGETVLHVVQGLVPVIGGIMKGRVDWPRRFDHIQQHTGQHILSQAFMTLFQAPTRSFRMLSDVCEIDVDLSDPTNDRIERAVELANNVIWENRPIVIKQVSPEEAAQLPVRKESARVGDLRLIEIEGFDLTPCGGTHAFQTGEVGLVAVRSWERARGLARIEFVAGRRALEDYRRANKAALGAAALLSGARDDAPLLAARSLEENKELHRRVRVLEEVAARVEAEDLIARAAILPEGTRLVAKTFAARDPELLKRLAQALIVHQRTIALLGSHDQDTVRLVFARSTDAVADMNALMKEACAIVEGRGGGKPDLAQGGGHKVEKLDEAISSAAASLMATSV
jgi:alanyl-tRNA synthetase